MSNIDKYNEIFEKTGEVGRFLDENLSNDEKFTIFNSCLNKIKESKAFSYLEGMRNSLTNEQKLDLYKNGNKINLNMKPLNGPINTLKNVKNNGIKNAASNNLFKTSPQIGRLFIQLGLFDKPEGLDLKQLEKDITKDAKNLKRDLILCKFVCRFIPEANAFLPLFDPVIAGADWYKKKGKDLLITRLKENDLKHNTQDNLKSILGESERKAAA